MNHYIIFKEFGGRKEPVNIGGYFDFVYIFFNTVRTFDVIDLWYNLTVRLIIGIWVWSDPGPILSEKPVGLGGGLHPTKVPLDYATILLFYQWQKIVPKEQYNHDCNCFWVNISSDNSVHYLGPNGCSGTSSRGHYVIFSFISAPSRSTFTPLRRTRKRKGNGGTPCQGQGSGTGKQSEWLQTTGHAVAQPGHPAHTEETAGHDRGRLEGERQTRGGPPEASQEHKQSLHAVSSRGG